MTILRKGGLGGGLLRRSGNLVTNLWSPSNDPKMRAYWDVTEIAPATSNNSITSWADVSGNGYTLTQPTSADQPTYDGTQINFSSGSELSILSRLGFGVSPDFCAVALYTCTQLSSPSHIVKLGGANNGAYVIQLGQNENTGIFYFDGNRRFNNDSYAIGPLVLSAIKVKDSNYGDGNFRIGGNALTLNSISNGGRFSNNNTQSFVVGGTGAFSLKALAVLNSSEIANIERWEGYLAHHHGETEQLSSDHPYKNSPPTA